MDDLTKMSVEELCSRWQTGRHHYAVNASIGATDMAASFGKMRDDAIAELERRIAENKPKLDHDQIMLADGRVVKVELQYWNADTEGECCCDLEDIMDSAGDGDECEVIPLLILPREVYRVSVAADGIGTHRKLEGDDLEDWKTRQKAWRDRARTLPTREAAEAARDAEKGGGK